MSNNKPEIKIKGKIQNMAKKRKTLNQNNLIFY